MLVVLPGQQPQVEGRRRRVGQGDQRGSGFVVGGLVGGMESGVEDEQICVEVGNPKGFGSGVADAQVDVVGRDVIVTCGGAWWLSW